MFKLTRSAISPADCSVYAANFVAMGGLAKPSVAEQIEIDWDMARRLDAKGDEYKAAGNFKMAQVCYSRALARANKAHNASK